MATERSAVFAGRFYPGQSAACSAAADDLLRDVSAPAGQGAIVPHAGWVYSGATAGLSVAAIAATNPETVVIFGAAHVPTRSPGSLFDSGSWRTPFGALRVDEHLARRFLGSPHVLSAPAVHGHEHSIEVQLPLLQRLLPDVRIVPIMIQPCPEAAEIGRFCATESAAHGRRVAFLGSTDLTHYGPAFGFEPHGRGGPGVRWAKEVNDRRFIRLIEALDADGIVPEAIANRNACGAGAVAAAISALRELGAERYLELRHTCSAEVDGGGYAQAVNSVGYEAGVFLSPA